MIMETIVINLENTRNKLCKQLLSLVDFSKGNNYEDTHIGVKIGDNSIVVSTFSECIFHKNKD